MVGGQPVSYRLTLPVTKQAKASPAEMIEEKNSPPVSVSAHISLPCRKTASMLITETAANIFAALNANIGTVYPALDVLWPNRTLPAGKVGVDGHTLTIQKGMLRPHSKRRRRYALLMARHSTDLGLSEHDKSVLQRREEHGWFVNMIAQDSEGPGFAYSFGLYDEFQHPEIVIFGLDSAIMHGVINDAGDQVREGVRYCDGDVTGELLEGYNCAFRQVNPLQYSEFFGWAVWFYGNSEFPALQLFWPDKIGRFPWDDGFTKSLREFQPDLSKPPASA